jgi:isopenicillin N synthase-like dioxygenase
MCHYTEEPRAEARVIQRAMDSSIPVIDVSPLFDESRSAAAAHGPHVADRATTDRAIAGRTATDQAIANAAATAGFFVARGFPSRIPIDRRSRARLLRIFDLPEHEIRPLWRRKFDPSHTNVYRGWFPLQRGFLTSKEGIDMGADVAYGPSVVRDDDPLQEATPLPAEDALPGWREDAGRYYLGMIEAAQALMHSLARSLDLPEEFFDDAFDRGLSTLRLIRYPVRSDTEQAAANDPGVWVHDGGERRYITGAPHVDSGFLTLLAQDGVAGLQARHRNGEWLDVPPMEETLAVNFGKVLERWTAGRIKATEHRVIGHGQERMSVPFFYEARADAEIAPLPSGAAFEPFLYGDHLWATTTRFVEFKGMESLRPPRRPA